MLGWATFLFDFRGPTLSLDYDKTLKPISLCTFLDKLHTLVLFTLDKVPTLCLIPKANNIFINTSLDCTCRHVLPPVMKKLI